MVSAGMQTEAQLEVCQGHLPGTRSCCMSALESVYPVVSHHTSWLALLRSVHPHQSTIVSLYTKSSWMVTNLISAIGTLECSTAFIVYLPIYGW